MQKLLIFLSILFLGLTTQAQTARLGNAVLVGNGCPAGSAGVTLSPDSTLISILFDSFSVDYNANISPQIHFLKKTCKIQIPVELPAGYAMDIMKLDYRGFYSVADKWNQFNISTTGLRIVLGRGMITGAPQVTTVKGPVTSDYLITHTLPRQARTECGVPFVLEFTVDMSIDGAIIMRGGVRAPIKGEVMASLDSVDAGGPDQSGAFVGVALKRCR